MASEIRVDKINSLSGVGTVTLSPTGVDIAGITTAATLRATTGIVTSLTAGSLTSLGDVTANGGDMTISGASAILHLIDTNDNPNYRVQNIGGTFQIYDATTDTARLSIASGGAATFSGSLSGTTGDFTGAVTLADGVANGLKIGNGQDLILQHNGTNTFIDNNTGDLTLQTTGSGTDINIESLDDVFIKVHGSENAIRCIGDGAVELYHDNTKRLETSGSGVVIPSGANNCLRVFGSNAAHATSALIIGQNNTTTSQLRAYGPDSSTNGRIEFRSSRSDASNTVNLIYDSGNLEFANGNGISFAATGDGSGTMSSELLDDYEEGAWTPVLNGTHANMGTGKGKYAKIGGVTHYWIEFSDPNAGSANGSFNNGTYITGFPYSTPSSDKPNHWTGTVSYMNSAYSMTLMTNYYNASDQFYITQAAGSLRYLWAQVTVWNF